jgi:hypothetical protein
MSMNLKYFSVDEADALIPMLTDILSRALDLKKQIDARVEEWRRIHDTLSVAEEAVIQGQVDFLVAQLDLNLERITALGCLPKDINEGLIDFPARVNGREVYLCWRMGEARIESWHAIADGARGRQPLDRTKI